MTNYLMKLRSATPREFETLRAEHSREILEELLNRYFYDNDLADAIDVATSTISDVRAGRRCLPRHALLNILALDELSQVANDESEVT